MMPEYAEWWELAWLLLTVSGLVVALRGARSSLADWQYVRQRRLRVLQRIASVSVVRAVVLVTAMIACACVALAFLQVGPITARNFETVVGLGGIFWLNIVVFVLVNLDGWTRHNVTGVHRARSRSRSKGPQ